MVYNGTVNDYQKVCSSCTAYIVLFAIFLMISVSISSVFICIHWYSKRNNTNANTITKLLILMPVLKQ